MAPTKTETARPTLSTSCVHVYIKSAKKRESAFYELIRKFFLKLSYAASLVSFDSNHQSELFSRHLHQFSKRYRCLFDRCIHERSYFRTKIASQTSRHFAKQEFFQKIKISSQGKIAHRL
jgi:hypothetical protein